MPLVSVVMSVYNDEERVGRSIDSILQQTFQDFEFIIINDGSTDGTAQVLDRYADQDSRIRVIHQENTGLTQALIRGCQQAQGQFIARQDSGDLSMPERLQAQSDFLTDHPDVSLVACSTSFVDPEGNIIFLREQSGYELEQGLVLDIDKIQNPPHHGSTMFLSSAYHQVGGYRSIFSVAQDIDLWLRLVEVGRCFCLDSILYQASLDKSGITSTRHKEQLICAQVAIEAAINRRNQLDESIAFTIFENADLNNSKISAKVSTSNFYYFLGGCLQKKSPSTARKYFQRAYRTNPLNWKALLKILITY